MIFQFFKFSIIEDYMLENKFIQFPIPIKTAKNMVYFLPLASCPPKLYA